MAKWQLQEAKAKLSEVIETAAKSGPQIITQRGVETAVVVQIDEWRRSQQPQGSTLTLLQVLRSGPQFDLNIPARGKMRLRKPVKF